MSREEKHWDDDWLFSGPVIAFSIIGIVTGWVIGNDKGDSLLSLIIGVVIGAIAGFIAGIIAGGFLDLLFDNEIESAKQQNSKSSESSNSSGTGNSEEWKKILEEILKGAKNYEKYYNLLESAPNDDFNTIRNNYRRLVRQYHPDYLGTNASEAMHKYANEMSQKINEAYEIIKKQHSVK